MKHFLCFTLAVMFFVLSVNVASFAAGNELYGQGSVQVGAVLEKYNYSNFKVSKMNVYNYAKLTNITGASTSMGVMFSVQAEEEEDEKFVSRTGMIAHEYIKTLDLFYDGVTTKDIEANMKGKYFFLKAELVGYPRVSTATLRTTFAP